MDTNLADNSMLKSVNLQLFAEEGEAVVSSAPAAGPQEGGQLSVEGQQAAPQQSVNPLWAWANEDTGAGEEDTWGDLPVQQPEQQVQEPAAPVIEEQPLILGKFKTQEDLANAYNEAQRKITEQGQTLSMIQSWFEQQKAQQEAQQQAQAQQQQQPQFTEEQIKQMNDQWFEHFSDNPIQAVAQLVQQIAGSMIHPLQQHYQEQQELSQWNRQISQTAAKYQDFDAMRPVIEQVIQEQPHLANLPNAVEVAYQVAKARSYQPPPTHEQLLQDQEFRQKILTDEGIRRAILGEATQRVQQQNANIPRIMTNQGGQPTVTPPNKPRSIREASMLARQYFRG